MPLITVAEALAEFQVIDQRIAQKQQLVSAFLLRDTALRDPLLAEGGSPTVLACELASIRALEERKVQLRRLIQSSNERGTITHDGQTRTIADWLVWKREVVARRTQFLNDIRVRIERARRAAAGAAGNVLVNLNEQELSQEIEALEERQGYLSGQVTLKNATMTVETPADDWKSGLEDRIESLLPRAGVALPGTSGTMAVWLTGFDPAKKINVIRVVREISGLGLKEVKHLVEQAPQVVKQGLSQAEASRLQSQLEDAGGRAMLR